MFAGLVLLIALLFSLFWNADNQGYFKRSSRIERKPSLKEMSNFQFKKDFKTIDIIQELNIDCKDLGIQLEVPEGEISSIWRNSNIEVRSKCTDTISYWLRGGEKMPATWKTFIEGLRQTKLHDLANRIEEQM